MNKEDDVLIEILTEELPPKSLRTMAEAFLQQIEMRLKKHEFRYEQANYFAGPRRLAVRIQKLVATQPDQFIERKGPALKSAFDTNGKPTKASEGFAKSCGVNVSDLITLKNEQGEWLGFKQHIAGKSIFDLLPEMVEQAAMAVPVAKRMRWGESDIEFVRPVHRIVLMYGDEVIKGTVLGVASGRVSLGHHFMSPGPITIPQAAAYQSLLASEGRVIASFAERREKIKNGIHQVIAQSYKDAIASIDEDLLDEVTGLVEWPIILMGTFDQSFLELPTEVLVSAMQAHQRYFPVYNQAGKLLPVFIVVSNVQTHDEQYILSGNERVLRARLSDAAFFYKSDQHQSLFHRLDKLKDIIYQAKLGSLYDKSLRLEALTEFLCTSMHVHPVEGKRAGLLSKTDLVTDMVVEFPELQGLMGRYYAEHDHEAHEVAIAIGEHYFPRYSGDRLPDSCMGQALAIADRIDLLVGVFGIGQLPTGDKDPFGLRRAAVGILRILIEKKLPFDLQALLDASIGTYTIKLPNANLKQDILTFMQERMRAWYLEQGVSADVFAAVSALNITVPLDLDERIKAVQAFKRLKEADTLSIANKRVSNILAKYIEKIEAKKINPAFFENEFEQTLAKQLELKGRDLTKLYQSGKYEEALLSLAELREPIDNFFDHVMVMTEDKSVRENRLLLLSQLRTLFLQVADIALLQS